MYLILLYIFIFRKIYILIIYLFNIKKVKNIIYNILRNNYWDNYIKPSKSPILKKFKHLKRVYH